MKIKWWKEYLYGGLAICILLVAAAGVLAVKGRDREVETIHEQEARPQERAGYADGQMIRVLLMTDGYAQTVHPQVSLYAAGGFTVAYGDEQEEHPADSWLYIAPDDARFQKGKIRVQAKGGEIMIGSLKRGYGTPSYSGVIELRTTAEGIAVINELPVETYLSRVVPSEMPSSYEMEALKAQAVCARSYAYRQMETYGYPEYEAHVNDSTDYQVYGNSAPADRARQAVEETKGEVVFLDDQIVTTYYYSTSCGKTTSMAAWGSAENEQNRYLQSVEVKGEDGDYEKNLPWYRWETTIPASALSASVSFSTGTDIGALRQIRVTRTGPGGIVLGVEASGDKGSVVVETENKIRRALVGNGCKIRRQDGSETTARTLLPSAFFTIEKTGDNVVIRGGGYGHGIGMSQNGANEMAKAGKTYKEILGLFFQGTKTKIPD